MAFRRGQWVSLTAPIDVIIVQPDGSLGPTTLPVGTVGIHYEIVAGLDGKIADRDNFAVALQADLIAAVPPGTGLVRLSALGDTIRGRALFHQVDSATGFRTLRIVLVTLDQLAAVASREQIPAARLATMAPGWTPAP